MQEIDTRIKQFKHQPRCVIEYMNKILKEKDALEAENKQLKAKLLQRESND